MNKRGMSGIKYIVTIVLMLVAVLFSSGIFANQVMKPVKEFLGVEITTDIHTVDTTSADYVIYQDFISTYELCGVFNERYCKCEVDLEGLSSVILIEDNDDFSFTSSIVQYSGIDQKLGDDKVLIDKNTKESPVKSLKGMFTIETDELPLRPKYPQLGFFYINERSYHAYADSVSDDLYFDEADNVIKYPVRLYGKKKTDDQGRSRYVLFDKTADPEEIKYVSSCIEPPASIYLKDIVEIDHSMQLIGGLSGENKVQVSFNKNYDFNFFDIEYKSSDASISRISVNLNELDKSEFTVLRYDSTKKVWTTLNPLEEKALVVMDTNAKDTVLYAIQKKKPHPVAVCSLSYHTILKAVVDEINAANKYGSKDVSYALVQGLIQAESSWNPYAGTSSSKGLMQLNTLGGTDSTWYKFKRESDSDVYSAEQNMYAGVNYLSYLLNRPGFSEEDAIASYNAGPSAANVSTVQGCEGLKRWQCENQLSIASIDEMKGYTSSEKEICKREAERIYGADGRPILNIFPDKGTCTFSTTADYVSKVMYYKNYYADSANNCFIG